MSFASSWYSPLMVDAINNLVNDQGCIVVASSGNSMSYTRRTPQEAHLIENKKKYPAAYSNVFGVGGIYGLDSSTQENFRMSIKHNITTSDGKYYGSKYYDDHGLSQATVRVASPGYSIDVICDLDDTGDLDNVEVTGTSYSAPQVAVAAYLASRLYCALNPNSPFTKYEFAACIMHSSENDPEGRTAPDKLYWEEVGEPQHNLGTYIYFYSYRVGYGSLDVYDMLEYASDLS